MDIADYKQQQQQTDVVSIIRQCIVCIMCVCVCVCVQSKVKHTCTWGVYFGDGIKFTNINLLLFFYACSMTHTAAKSPT